MGLEFIVRCLMKAHLKNKDIVMSRLLDIPAEKRTAEQSTAFERLAAGRGHIPTPYKVWIHSPELALGMESIGTFLNKRSSLTRRQIEIGIVQIAAHWDGEYALNNHIRAAQKAGIDDATIEKLKSGQKATFADTKEQAFYDLTSSLIAKKTLDDADFARVEREIGRNGIAEAMVLIGYYGSVAMAMKIHKVEPGARGD